jgi:hypothetical protein
MDMVVCWRDEAELERRLSIFRQLLPTRFGEASPIELLDGVRAMLGHLIDRTSEEVVEQIRNYEAAGLDELLIDCFDCDDLDGLEVLALSHSVAGSPDRGDSRNASGVRSISRG